MAKTDPWTGFSGNPLITKSGGLKEWKPLNVLTINFSAVSGTKVPICSGAGDLTDSYGTILPKIPTNKKFLIYGMTCVNANTGNGVGRCFTVGLHTSSTTTDSNIYVIQAKATGPYMISFEIPIEIDGSQTPVLYGEILSNLANNGSTGITPPNANNWLTLSYMLADL